MFCHRSALVVGLVGICWLSPVLAAGDVGEENFAQLLAQIKPQAGESRWLEVPWLLDLHEARRQAAAAGKPLFVYSGGGATGIGAC